MEKSPGVEDSIPNTIIKLSYKKICVLLCLIVAIQAAYKNQVLVSDDDHSRLLLKWNWSRYIGARRQARVQCYGNCNRVCDQLFTMDYCNPKVRMACIVGARQHPHLEEEEFLAWLALVYTRFIQHALQNDKEYAEGLQEKRYASSR